MFRFLLNFFLVAIAVVIIAVISPSVMGYKLIVIESGSMEPTLKVWSMCYVKKESVIRERDIVTYITGKDNELLVTHRVVGVNSDGTFTLKGDNSNMEDKQAVSKEDIIGVTKFNIPYVGYCIKALSTIEGKLVAILALIILLAFSELADKTVRSSKSALRRGILNKSASKLIP